MLIKACSKKVNKILIKTLVNALFLSTLLSFSHGLLKWLSTQKTGGHLQTMIDYWWVVGGAICVYVFIFFYYAYVLRHISINILYPVYTGLSIVFVFSIGVLLFREPYNWQHMLGCFLIIIGIFLVSGIGGWSVDAGWMKGQKDHKSKEASNSKKFRNMTRSSVFREGLVWYSQNHK